MTNQHWQKPAISLGASIVMCFLLVASQSFRTENQMSSSEQECQSDIIFERQTIIN